MNHDFRVTICAPVSMRLVAKSGLILGATFAIGMGVTLVMLRTLSELLKYVGMQ
jgi:hypothetical protein